MGIPTVKVDRISDLNELGDIHFDTQPNNKGKFKSFTCQNIITFDIETSNGFLQDNGEIIAFDHDLYAKNPEMYENAEKQSLMYCWQCAIETKTKDGIKVFMGRTWDDFDEFLHLLTLQIRRSAYYRRPSNQSINLQNELLFALKQKHSVECIIYIHNLGFEFQHLRNLYNEEFSKVSYKKGKLVCNTFARSARKPMKTYIHKNRTKISFKDSLVLTQKTLKAWGKDDNLPVQKLDEDKDYYLPIRTPNTPLTDENIEYSINDVVTMVYGIERYRDKWGRLEEIPLTQTGSVRRTCVASVTNKNPLWAMQCVDAMKSCDNLLYGKLRMLFSGGWTHANSKYSGRLLSNIRCFDFASSYPYVMCTMTYPLTPFEQCDLAEYDELVKQDLMSIDLKYHYFLKVKVKNFCTKKNNTLWSTSKCIELKNHMADNGKIYGAEEAVMLMTDLDWHTFQQAYTIEDYEVIELYKSEAGLLPVELILTILEYFGDKTALKGTGEESKYVEAKQFINSIYGCAVTNIISDIVYFNEGWSKQELDDDLFEILVNEISEETTFISYQCGVWVTAWARHNLWECILEFDEKIAYCDTDSAKGLFDDNDLKWFDAYNLRVAEKEKEVADRLGFDENLFHPLSSKGEEKRLGIFEREDDCLEFKTLGAKRYVDSIQNKDGSIEIQCTIAGLPKEAGQNKITQVSDFNSGIVWNTKESGKLMACYNDNQSEGTWVDYNGDTYKPLNYPKFGTCLIPTTFDMSMSEEYVDFINFINSSDNSMNDTIRHDTNYFVNLY